MNKFLYVAKVLLVAGIVTVSILIGISACTPKTDADYRNEALQEARAALEIYAAQHHVPVEEFKEPKLTPHAKMIDEPTRYSVYYYHPEHFFNYNAHNNDVHAYPRADEAKRGIHWPVQNTPKNLQ